MFRLIPIGFSETNGSLLDRLITVIMPPRRPGPASGRRRPSKNSSSVVARIQEQQKRLEQEQLLQHQRSLAAALTAREVDADDSDYGIELDGNVSILLGIRCLPPNLRNLIVRYCFLN